jgi:ribosome recycling factor
LSIGIDKTLEKLNADLSKLRTGGKFNPELLEDVRVHLIKGDKKSIRLGELAQVLPKGGRSLMVLVGEKDVSTS